LLLDLLFFRRKHLCMPLCAARSRACSTCRSGSSTGEPRLAVRKSGWSTFSGGTKDAKPGFQAAIGEERCSQAKQGHPLSSDARCGCRSTGGASALIGRNPPASQDAPTTGATRHERNDKASPRHPWPATLSVSWFLPLASIPGRWEPGGGRRMTRERCVSCTVRSTWDADSLTRPKGDGDGRSGPLVGRAFQERGESPPSPVECLDAYSLHTS
jgi:hypothetical protein